MKTLKNQIEPAKLVANIINLVIIMAGGMAVVYGLALYIVKYL